MEISSVSRRRGSRPSLVVRGSGICRIMRVGVVMVGVVAVMVGRVIFETGQPLLLVVEMQQVPAASNHLALAVGR